MFLWCLCIIYIHFFIIKIYKYVSFIISCIKSRVYNYLIILGTVVAVIVWQLDLQLPIQSVPITTNVVSSNLDQGEVYNRS